MSRKSGRSLHALLRLVAGCCIAITALACAPARAATLTWGTSGTGGGGTWSTGTNTWWNGATMQAWNNAANDDAVFRGTPGTVTLTTSNTANSLTFDSFTGTYTLALNGQTLAIGGGGITMNAGAGNATFSGAGTILLTSTQAWTNNASASTLTVSSTVNTNGFGLTIGGAGATSISGLISGSGGLTKTGAGKLTLSGANTFSGGLTIRSGTVGGTVATSFSTGLITLGDTTGSANATLSGEGSVNFANNILVAGGNTGTAAINNVTGVNPTFSGLVTLQNHDLTLLTNGVQTLTLSGPVTGTGALYLSNNVTVANNGGVLLSGYVNNAGAIVNNSTGLAAGDSTLTGNRISGLIGPAVTGITQSSSNTFLNLTNATGNQFTGTPTITLGQIRLGSQKALYKAIYNTNGMSTSLGLNAAGQTQPWLGGLSGTGNLSATILGYSGTVTALTLNPQAGASVTYSGTITNGAAAGTTLTKEGPGTQTLTGSNTYTGVTSIQNGTLVLGGPAGSILSSGTVTVAGGVLSLDNSAGWANRLADSGTYALGSLTLTSSNGAGTQTETIGNATFATAGRVSIVNGSSGTDRTDLAMGTVTRNAGAAIDFAGTNGTLGAGANSPNVRATTLPANTNGILPWATVNATSWAVGTSGTIQAYAGSFSDPTVIATDTTANTQLSGGGTLTAARNFNSLNVIATAPGQSFTLNSGANLNLSSGGILKSGAAAYSIAGSGTIGAGTTGAGTELITHVDGGTLTISAPLNTAILGIAKGGTGTLVLAGTRAATMSGAFGIAGGQLEFQGNTTTVSGVISGPGGVTVNLTPGQSLTLSGANTYAGPTVVTSGYAKLGATLSSRSNLSINNVGVAEVDSTTRTIGTGPDQLQITGGTSGLAPGRGGAPFSFGGSVVVWGSPSFNPDAFVVGTSLTARASSLYFNNSGDRIDLNGATRTIFDDKPIGTASNELNTFAAGISTTPYFINTTGTAGLIKTGTGELVIGGANTYNGPTTVSAGVLTVSFLANGGAASNIGLSSSDAANLVIGNNATFRYWANAGTNGGAVSTDRSFTISGSTGTLDVSAGPVTFTNTASPAYGTANQARTLVLTGLNTGTGTLAANIADNGTGKVSIVKSGAALWVLSGASTYTGTTTITSGLLSVSATNNLGSISAPLLFIGGGLQVTGTALASFGGRPLAFTSGSTVTLDIQSPANVFTVDQVLAQGLGGLTKSGSGALALTQANTYFGNTTITGGTLQVGAGGASGSLSGLGPILGSAALAVNRSDTLTQSTGLGYFITGTGSLTNLGTGTLVLDRPNYFSGLTRATSGTIQLANALALQNSPIDTNGAGRFSFSGTNAFVVGGLTGTGNLSDDFDATSYATLAALTLNPGVTGTYAGVISGGSGMNLVVGGAGTQVLTGSSTYTGTTTLGRYQGNAGTLSLSGSGGIANSSAYVFTGGNLTLTNTTSIEGAFNRLNDSAPITSNGGTLTVNNTSGNIYAETAGTVNLASGQFNVALGTNMATGTQTLTFAGLGRAATASGSTATVTFSAAGGLAATAAGNRIAVTDAGTTTAGQVIGPWATVGTAAGTPTDYAVYSNGFVVPANIAASAENTWTTGQNATLSGAAALTATRTLNTLRYTGAALSLDIGTNQLQTYGILNAGTGLLTVTGGTLTTPSGGGSLFLTANSLGITVSSTIADNGGAVTLVKSGPGTLTLTGTKSYSGGTVVNAGTIDGVSAVSVGTGPITIAGNATLIPVRTDSGIGRTLANSLVVNDGASLTVNNSTQFYNLGFTGTASGNGQIVFGGNNNGNDGFSVGLFNTANTFTGPIRSTGGGAMFVFNSLADSPNSIQLNGAGGIQLGGVPANPTAVATTFNSRQIDLYGTGGGVVNSSAASTSATLTINTDLLVSGAAGARTFTLGGGNTGTNAFNGRISDGVGSPISVTKAGAGLWLLSGTNSYSGGTTISAGTLLVSNSFALGVGPTTLTGGTLLVGSGAGVGLNIVNFNGGSLQATGADLTVPNAGFLNANSTISGTQGVTLAGLLTNNAGNFTLTSSITSGTGSKLLTIAGTTFLQESTSAAGRTMTLAGTGNTTITGPIVNGGVAGNGSFTITNTGLTILAGTNTYSGITTISAGTVVLTNTSSIGTSALTMTGGALDVSSGLTLTANNPQNWNGSFTFVGSNPLNIGTGAVTLGATPIVTVTANTLTVGGTVGGGFGLTKSGAGSLVLSNFNTYTGVTTVQQGSLVLGGAAGSILSSGTVNLVGLLSLDNSAGWANRLANSGTFSLGSLTLTGATSTSGTETIGNATFATGGKISVVNGSGGTDRTDLAMGTVTRNAGAAIDFAGTNGTLGAGPNSPNVTSSGAFPGTINGILPWATVNGTSWAENSSNSIRAYSGSFVSATTLTTSTTANAQLSGAGTLAASGSANSLNVIATAPGQSFTLNSGVSLNLSSGAVLKSGADAYSIAGAGTLGSGTSGAGTELIAHVDGGPLTISAGLNSAITGIAKGGAGTLVLAGSRGTLSAAVGVTGTLEFQGNGSTLSGVVSGPGGLTVNLTSGQSLTVSGANTFSGQLTVARGTLYSTTVNNKNANGTFGNSTLPIILGSSGQTGRIAALIDGATSTDKDIVLAAGGTGEIQFGNILTFQITNADRNLTLNGIISGAGNFAKLGGAAVVLSGINTYTGTTTVVEGPLRLNGAFALPGGIGATGGTSPLVINGTAAQGGAVLELTAASGDFLRGLGTGIDQFQIPSGTSGFSANGSARQVIVGNDPSFELQWGIPTFNPSAFLFNYHPAVSTGALTLQNGIDLSGTTRTIQVSAGSFPATISGNIRTSTGTAGLTKAGAGTLILTGTNTNNGTMTFNGGTLSVASDANLGVGGNLVFSGGTLLNSGTATFNLTGRQITWTPGTNVNFSGTGGGTFVIDQSYLGSTSIGAGTLRLDGSGAMTGWLLNSGTFQVNRAGLLTQGTDIPAFMSGTGNLVYSGGGTLVLNQPNLFSGFTRATSGTIQLANSFALQNSRIDTTGGGGFTFSGNNSFVIGGLTGTAGNQLSSVFDPTSYAALSNLTLNPASGVTGTYGGVINGAAGMSLTIAGAGTQVLEGVNTYTGTTVLGRFTSLGSPGSSNGGNPGTLVLSGSGSIGSSSAYVFNGGNLTLTNTNTAEGGINRLGDSTPISVTGGGTLTVANTGATGGYAETIGTATLSSGRFNVVLSSSMSTGTQTLTMAGLSRAATASGSTATVTFSALGTAPQAAGSRNMILISGSSAVTLGSGTIIGPWATVGTAAGTQTDYASLTAGYVTPANIAASAPGTWSSAAVAYSLGSGSTAMTASGTAIGVRYVGTASGTLNIQGNQLQTYGLLTGSGGALTVATTAGGFLTTPAGGNLFVTPGNGGITISGSIADAGASPVTLVTSGAGVTFLSGTNSYSGGTVINAGTLRATVNAGLGAAGAGITFNGSAGLSLGNNVSSTTVDLGTRPITVTNGAIAGIYHNWADTTITVGGPITGDGGLNWGRDPVVTYGGGSGSVTMNLNSAANTFTGPIRIGSGDENAGAGGNFNFNSLADSTSPITMNFGGSIAIRMGAAATANVSIPSRPIDLWNSNATWSNQNATYTLTLGAVTTTTSGAKTLNIGASGAGATIAGPITDGAGQLAVSKSAGTWVLSGSNTYTGNTALGNDSGQLTILGKQALSPYTTITSIRGATLSLRMDDAGVVNLGNKIVLSSVDTTSSIFNALTINVGNNGGGTTGSTLVLGTVDFWSGSGGSATRGIITTGSNGYRVQFGNVELNYAGPGTFTGGPHRFQADGAPITITGTVRQISGNAGSTPFQNQLSLGGTATGNVISGIIADPLDIATNPLATRQNIFKQGAGTWTFSGANTYSGTTTVAGGVLRVNGSIAGGPVVVSGGAIGGTGSIGGGVTVSSAGGVDLRDGSVGTLTMSSTLGLTGAAGANNLSFDLASGGSTTDKVAVTGVFSMATSGAGVVNLNQLGGVGNRLAAGTYDLITAASGFTAGGGQFQLLTTKAFGQTFSLADTTTTALRLTTTQVSGAVAATITGTAVNGSWQSPSSFTGNAVPDYMSNVVINSAVGTTPLNGSTDINSLTFGAGATTGVTISAGSATAGTPAAMLVIEAAAANGNTAGNGITLSSALPVTHTISANVGLASNQTWTVGTGNTLAVSGTISDFGAGYRLTKAGNGILTLSAANTFTGGVTLNAGILNINSDTALNSNAPYASGSEFIINGGTINNTSGAARTPVNPNPIKVGGDFAYGTGGGAAANNLTFGNAYVDLCGAARTITTNGNGVLTFSGLLTNGSLVKDGFGTLTYSYATNAAPPAVPVTVNRGTLLWSGGVILSNTLAVNAGGNFSLLTSAAATQTVNALSLTDGATLTLDWAAAAQDRINSVAAATTSGNVGIRLNFSTASGTGGVLLSAPAGGLTANGTRYYLANNTNYTAPITATDTAVLIGGTTTATALGNAYWLGNQVTGAVGAMALSSGTFSNWASAAAGTLAGGVVPGSAANVIFGATGGSQQSSVTTGADMTLNSITFNDTTAVTISGSNLITLNSTATGTATTTGAGQTVTSASSAVAVTAFANATNTIAANLGLSGAQSVSVAAGKTLTISGVITGAGSLTKRDPGTLTLSGQSNYTGLTTVTNGTLSFNSIADVGAASALGSPFSTADGTIFVGASGTAATLVYTGAGHSTNRVVNLAGTTGGATLDQSGSGLLRFTNAFTATGAGLKTLTLQGSTSGTGEIANTIVDNSASNRTSIVKAGSGTWVLSGSNTYTGTTTITGGVLQIGAGGTTGSIVNTSPVSVASGAAIAFNRSDALTYSGTISGLGGLTKLGNGGLTLNAAQTYTGPTTIGGGTLITGVANAISGSSALTIGSAGSRGALEIDHALTISNLTYTGLGGEISTASTGTATFSSTTGTATINVLSGSNAFHANATLSSPTLVDVADGAYFSFHNNLAGSGSGTLTKSGLGTLNLTGDNDTLQSNFFITAGLVTIGSGMNQIGTGTTTLSGGATLDLGGQSFSDRIVVLNGTILNAGGTATTTTIQGTSSIDGSTAGTYNITSTGSAVFNAAVGSGTSLVSVNVNSGAGSGGQATFNEAIGSLGNIVVNNGGTAAFASTVAGSVISHGASTFTGNVLSTSEVQVQSDGSAAFAGGMAGHTDVAGTATFTGAVSGTADVFGTATFGSASSLTGKLTTHSAGTTLLDNVAAAITGDIHNDGQLTIDRATGSQTISGAISGTGGIVKTGAGVLVLEGANSSYTGGITLSSGTIRAGSANALGLGTLALNAGGLDLNGQALTIGMLTGSAGTSVSSSMAGAASLKSEFEGSSTFNGVISNGAGTVAFEKAGGGTLTLTGVQTYTGNTIISGGVLALDSGASLANSIYIKAGNVAGDNGALDVTALGSFAVANGQMLGGHGEVIGDVTIANGAILSPGGSVGTLINNGDMTWGGGGQFLFEIFNATSDNAYGPGTDWDQLFVVGNLDITSSSGNPYVINLQTLADPNDNTAGLMPVENWNDAQEYAWKFVTASTTITSFNASVFTVNPANFQNPYGGTFSVQRGDQVTGGTDSELYIVYAAIPEPGTLVLAAIGLAAAGWHLRRRRK